ncbi:MAG: hypothetical protein ACTHME_01670 [Candidatus Nitrosocosmicus sp.]
MNCKFKLSLLFGVLALMGSSLLIVSISPASAQSNYTIKVAKTTQGDFNVTNGATFVGSFFDTTYIMTGTINDFIKAKNSLISSIIDDFDKSSTIGYIKMNNTVTQTNTNVTGIANPFVSKEQIDEKVKSVLSYALDKIEHPVGVTLATSDSRQIKCQFGNALDDFWCDIPTFAIK